MGAPYWLVALLNIWLLANPIATMSDPLPATVGTGDQFAMLVLLNVLGNADKARSSAPSTGLAEHRKPPPEK
jgi:hypothetical protein